jgi:serine/threonine-protein kinase
MLGQPPPDPLCPQCGRKFPGLSFCPDDGLALLEPSGPVGPFGGRRVPADRPSIRPGDVLAGRYRTERSLGEGGMGVVWQVVDLHTTRPMALKVLHAVWQSDDRAVRRFQREAKATARMDHPNICRVTDFGVSDEGAVYLVMELLQGVDLFDTLQQERFLPPRRAVPVATQVAAGLGHAHARGVIHRDLKPENIFLLSGMPPPDYVKVLDFGIAKMLHGDEGPRLTVTGEVVGTPEYLSPEQAGGGAVDHRADLYSLGVSLYRMLAGRLPFRDRTKLRLVQRQVSEAPQPFRAQVLPQEVPAGLEAVTMRLLEKDPARRYQTVGEVQAALAEARGVSR